MQSKNYQMFRFLSLQRGLQESSKLHDNYVTDVFLVLRQYLKIMNYFSVHVLNVEIFNNLDNHVSCFWIRLFTTTCLFVYQWSIYSVDNFKIWQKFPKIWPKSDPYFTKISDQNLTKFWEISDLILNHRLRSQSTWCMGKSYMTDDIIGREIGQRDR